LNLFVGVWFRKTDLQARQRRAHRPASAKPTADIAEATAEACRGAKPLGSSQCCIGSLGTVSVPRRDVATICPIAP
jgi:hypothetical protein